MTIFEEITVIAKIFYIRWKALGKIRHSSMLATSLFGLFWTMAVSGSVDIFSWVYYMCPCNSALTLTVFPHPTHLSECWITHITFQGRTRCHCPSLWLVNDHPYSALIGWFKNVRKHIQTDSAASTSNTRFNQDNT